MGASPKHRLSDEATKILEWLNAPRDHIDSSDIKLLEVRDFLYFTLHNLWLHWTVKYASSLKPKQARKGFAYRELLEIQRRPHRVLDKEKLKQYLTELDTTLPALPRKLVFDKSTPHFVPAPERLDPIEQRRNQFAELLTDLWTKGYDRLKRCAWPDCNRFLWDPTTSKLKSYCECRHDKDRACLRAQLSR